MTPSEERVSNVPRKDTLMHDVILRLIKALNLLLVAMPFAACWLAYYESRILLELSMIRSMGLIFLFLMLYFFFGRVYDAFYISLKRVSELFFSQIMGILMADGCMFIILWLLSGRFPDLLPAMMAFTNQIFFSLLWCRYAHIWYFSRFSGKKTAIIYDDRQGIENLFDEYGLDKNFDIQSICSIEECLEQKMDMLKNLDVAFLCDVHSHDRNTILKYCIEQGIIVYMIPRVGDVIMSGTKHIHMFHLPIVRAERYHPPFEYVICKRIFDVVISLIVIVLTSPLMLAVAIAVRLQDGGPALYRQTRLTKDGKQFSILKFRSMRMDAEKDGVARLSSGEYDDRITPVGRFIRGHRLDELPQLFNVLGGSMSIVGPRPERPEIAAQYCKELPEFSLRLQAKAGITGYAQVYGKYNTRPDDKLKMDLMYISNPGFIEDLKIIFVTIQILFQKESSEGVAAGQMTAIRRVLAEKAKKSA